MRRIRAILKKIALKLTPFRVKVFYGEEFVNSELSYKYRNHSYSQEGEDLILERYFANKHYGFFIDVGAHHPIRFSNTYRFYLSGWRGINIDATPGSMELFNKLRPEDINIEAPISDVNENLAFYIFNEAALNTFSEAEALRKDGLNGYQIIEKKNLQTQRLETILDQYLPEGGHIDFFTIDVEGFDLKVLKSNNWDKYKPEFVLVEDLQSDLEKALSSELYQYMKLKGYKIVARTFNTLFFRNMSI